MNTQQHRRLACGLLFAGCTLGLLMTLTFRTQAQTAPASKSKQGTAASPGQSHAKGRAMEMDGLSRLELEKAHFELERAKEELSKQDWKKLEIEMNRAKEEMEKAHFEMERAKGELLKQDWKKMETEMNRVKEEMEKALKTSHEAIEIEGLQLAMAEAEKRLAKQQGQIAMEMKKAERQFKLAQERLNVMNKGMELMEKEGLIKPGESINLDWQGDRMILNGKKQSKAVSDKYRKYFKHETNYSNVVL